jgi:DNA-binding transcriptional regulator YhcF (GntR family)
MIAARQGEECTNMQQKDPAPAGTPAHSGPESEPKPGSSRSRRRKDGLSYKFQRLRERLRKAITDGEFEGKLPGERTLARRFMVNAKTLSKALTDLAAEGLLDRSIGRGTYVKGSAPQPEDGLGRWLIVCDKEREAWTTVRDIRSANPQATVVHDVSSVRPSFLRQFDAVIDFGLHTPEGFLRDLVVRNVPVVAINREPDVYSINVVGPDRAMAAGLMARDLFMLGHRDVAVVETLPRSPAGHAVNHAAARYAPDALVRVCAVAEALGAVQSGATAVLCDCPSGAIHVRDALESAGVGDVSLCAVGCCDDDAPVSGYYVHQRLVAESVLELLRAGGAGGQRPTAVWLATRYVDRGTVRALQHQVEEEAA